MVYGNIEENQVGRPEDPGSSCPNCGAGAGYEEGVSVDDFGNTENWLKCYACGALTDDDELLRIRREVMA